ncbi:MAG TPA: hypothetical protein VFI03_00930 [Solirubrobacterales bacterium]|nr:hypothetical protein [Solirubrobacterales bacterium]
MGRRIGVLTALALTALATLALAASAQAAPQLEMKARWAPQNLIPGENGLFVLRVRNYGDADTSGTVTVTEQLPPGVTRIEPLPFDEIFGIEEGIGWKCEGLVTVTCTTTKPIRAFDDNMPYSGGQGDTGLGGAPGYAAQIYIRVAVDSGAGGGYVNVATVTGGGSDPAVDEDPLRIASDPTEFGITPESGEADFYDAAYPAGEPQRQAGAHPFELRVNFDFNLQAGEAPSLFPGFISPFAYSLPVERVRTVKTILPKGLIGNPEATPKCTASDFLKEGVSQYTSTACAPETQVGTITLLLNAFANETRGHGDGSGSGLFTPASWTRIPVYNLEPPKGYPADFAFNVGDYRGHIYPTIDPGHGYAIKALTPYISGLLPVRSAEFTMWGVPADPAHDWLRSTTLEQGGGKKNAYGASSKAPIKPLLTMPLSCGDHGKVIVEAESYAHQGQWKGTQLTTDSLDVTGCEDPRIRFHPEVDLQPTSRAAGGPTGLQVNLRVPQRNDTVTDADELYEQNGDIQAIATPPLKKAVVTLPEGMTISTSAAQGLGNCSPAQIGLGTDSPVTCPANSQYGTLTLYTPILPKDAPMTGKIYVAKQNDNPFDNFLSLYLAIQEPERGLLVKIPGKVDLDPVSGQIRTTFDDLPEFPVSDMEMNLKGGVRAALANPSTCGTKTITAEFYSWAAPNTPVTESSSYEITHKDDGTPCVKNLSERAFAPELTAGTISPSAGSYSPFAFRLQRTDNDQEFSQLGVGLPQGLLAKISGITKCADAAIAQAEAPGRSGAEEAANPSCPASSLIGSTEVGSGVGQVITYLGGKAYLAGPYKGAPLSMVVITPIVAGPYDLGVIAVRSKIDVNPETTQASVSTDPFPQIFKGIPVRIRDIQVKVDRQDTIINPTSCDPMQITSRVTGTGGDVNTTGDDTAVDLANRFQAANCANLSFKPNLSFLLKGGTHRGDYPAFSATLRARPSDANIARTAVTLPHSAFLAQEHIRTVCTRVQFAVKQCPAASVYGYAKATSPLFDETLEGPVYLRSSSNPLPDLVATLNGDIDVVLSGRIDSVDAQIRNTFDVVPDAPVTKFTLSMQGGKKGLLVNSRNLCKAPSRADVRMTGQNGKRYSSKPLVVAQGCKKARKGKGAKKR